MKFVVFTLGCKVNETESLSIMRDLIALGHEVTEQLIAADAYIVNTCAVTAEAARKSRQMISRIKKVSSNAPIFMVGCATEENPESFRRENVCLIEGNRGKGTVARRVLSILEGSSYDMDNLDSTLYEDNIFSYDFRNKKYIKIHDGCNYFCSYCIVPFLRGRSRSRTMESILEEAKTVKGKEIVLTGINISDYGSELGYKLTDLIRAMAQIDVPKSLASLEIRIIDEQFLVALKQSGFKDSFHLSIQSMNSDVLRAMNRKYRAEDVFNCVELIRKHFEGAIITADIIAGFPTETQAQHEQSLENLKKLNLNRAHIFPFSPREGTAAAKLKDLGKAIKEQRALEYRKLYQ